MSRPKIDEMIGAKFGRLTVLLVMQERTKSGQLQFLCQCECGEKISANGNNLRSGVTRSCGCLRAERAREMAQKKNSWRKRFQETK